LNLGTGDVDTRTPMGSMVFTVMAALAQMEREIKRERATVSVAKRRAVGRDLGRRRPTFTDSQSCTRVPSGVPKCTGTPILCLTMGVLGSWNSTVPSRKGHGRQGQTCQYQGAGSGQTHGPAGG
jgi:DNA invertase Pin-like site-specific DNA recombinase